MRIAIFIALVASVGACDKLPQGTFHDLGAQRFKQLGDPCNPDTPPASECGYWPQYSCISGICSAACNTTSDCPTGTSCVGAGDMVAGQCQLAASDGGA